MPDLLRIKFEGWALSVWSRDVAVAQLQRRRMLESRGSLPLPLVIRVSTKDLIDVVPSATVALDSIYLETPIFFENRSYEFEFEFFEGSTSPAVTHRLNSVQNCFRQIGKLVRGTVNFGNDLGWFKFHINFSRNDCLQSTSIAFEVLPTKMDMRSDLDKVNQEIDKVYPLWRFSFAKRTDHELSRSRKPHERFPLLWLALFRALREELEVHIGVVCNAPHARLQDSTRKLCADQLKGKLSPNLEERVGFLIAQNRGAATFNVISRKLSVNTPENRFVRMVLTRSRQELANFSNRARLLNGKEGEERLSEAFFREFEIWSTSLSQRINHPLFDGVGEFDGKAQESQVLYQRTGYSGVYRVWLQLKQYLEVFGKQAAISVKSVAELYEVWCLLEIRRILISVGFTEQSRSVAKLPSRGLEKELDSSIGAAFQFCRDDGLTIRLAHEPIYGKPQAEINKIYSWNATQKPDIVLEVTFPNKEKIHWLFDAKYRIDTSGNESDLDLVPDDAINQMHRYRDALIHLSGTDEGSKKTRPFIGAYVIYPGWFPDGIQRVPSENPYAEAITAIGIGAFPALPGQKNEWLTSFFSSHLARQDFEQQCSVKAPDQQLVQESVRIAPTGLTVKRDEQLVFVAEVGPNRTDSYLTLLASGTAAWYHTRDEAIDRQSISREVMSDITHVAIAVHTDIGSEIKFVYSVKKVSKHARRDITPDQSGILIPTSDGIYWLFELGDSKKLNRPLLLSREKHFRFALCTLNELKKATKWSDLMGRYTYLYSPQRIV
jgi:uncharacterized protein